MKAKYVSYSSNSSQTSKIIQSGQRVLKMESEAINALCQRIDEDFVQVVQLIDRCKGHLIITGIGKSGLVGKKIAATFSSAGIPAVFLHAAEGCHGDLGVISQNDVVIALSNSGETDEILRLLPTFNRLNVSLVAITGNPKSNLGKRSDFVLNIGVGEEACSLGLLPTSSTTATLAMGDALAVSLLEIRGFKEEDFALNHPGGSLGRKLLTLVNDLMHTGDAVPKVLENSAIHEVISEMSRKGFGSTLVIDGQERLLGIITDGDLRRMIETKSDLTSILAKEVMSPNPKTIHSDNMATKAVKVMETHKITSLVVSDQPGIIHGIIHLQDLLKAGIV